MAVKKLSQIASGGAFVLATDQLVAVRSGTSDVLVSTTQITTVASSATPTPTGDTRQNELYVTALATSATIAAPTGTPALGNLVYMEIKDNGVAKTLAFNAVYRAGSTPFPTTTTVGRNLKMLFRYSLDSKFDLVAATENY